MRDLKSAVFVCFLAVLAILSSGCGSQSPAIADIAGTNVPLSEFESIFAKNNGGPEAAAKLPIEEREKFLDLYLKFKLKVKEARNRGYDKDPEIQAELADYKRNLSVSYFLSKDFTEPQLQEMYRRRLEEARVSHILVQISDPKDTLTPYTKALKIIDSSKSGVPFEQLAVNNSQDPSASQNKGDIYYFSSGVMVPDFENAVFAMKPGEITQKPVRTQYGYHIIKLTERHPNPGSVKVSHIMVRIMPGASPEDSLLAWQKIRSVRDSIKAGSKFEEMALRHSDDKYSSETGGDIGFLERRRTVKEFDEAVFKLNVGMLSDVIASPFGLHLAKVTEIKPVGTYQDLEQELKSFFQNYRFEAEQNALVSKLKKDYSFVTANDVLEACTAAVDTNKTTSDSNWDSSFAPTIRGKVLFTFAGNRITVDSVLIRAKANPELQAMSFKNSSTFQTILDKVGKTLVLEYRSRDMDKKYPELAQIMKEYEEGVLLFKAEQTEVWNRVNVNDSALMIYFEANRSKYQWPDRVNVQEIYVLGDSVAKVVHWLVTKQKYDFDSVAAEFNQRSATKEKNGVWGLQPSTTNAIIQHGWGMQEGLISEPIPFENGFSIIRALKRDPAREKTFQEAGTELSSHFQEYESKRLENAWYESLKKKYPVTIFKEVLAKAFASPGQKAK